MTCTRTQAPATPATRRTGPVAPARAIAAAALALLLLPACAAGGDNGPGKGLAGAAGAAEADGPTDGGRGPDEQATPGSTVAAFYRHAVAGEFAAACALVSPAVLQGMAGVGKDCAQELASDIGGPEERARIGTVAVDEQQVEEDGDVARVPASAITETGGAGDPAPYEFEGGKLSRIGGLWYVVE